MLLASRDGVRSVAGEEERACYRGQDGVDVGFGGLRNCAWANLEFVDRESGDCRFVDGPKQRLALVGRGEALGGGGEALSHAEREAEVDGKRKAGPGCEKRARKRVKDCGVDQAGVGRQVVAWNREVGGGGDHGVGKVAQARGTE